MKPNILELTKREFAGKTTVAIIGKTSQDKISQGKTVITTLLYDTIFNFYYPKHNETVNAKVLKGYDILEIHQNKIFGKGEFPESSLSKYNYEISIELISKIRPVKKIKIIIKDPTGENISEVLSTELTNSKEICSKIINMHKESNRDYGPLTYLIFSKMYVLLIDCDEFEDWKNQQTILAQIIATLKKIKEAIGETRNHKFHDPIAIIFTKYDKLNDEIAGLDSDELISKYLPEFESSLEEFHNGEINHFKMQIEGIEEKQGKKRTKTKDSANNHANQMNVSYKSHNASEQVTKLVSKIIEPHHINNVGKKQFKIQLPVEYSDHECTRLIAWLMETLDRG